MSVLGERPWNYELDIVDQLYNVRFEFIPWLHLENCYGGLTSFEQKDSLFLEMCDN